MKKLDLKSGFDIVKLNAEEWTIIDENNKIIGIMKEDQSIKAFKKTNSILFNNQGDMETTKYQFELKSFTSSYFKDIDSRDNYCLVNIDFGENPMVQVLATGDRMLSFKMTENGFTLIRESASDRKEIKFKVSKTSDAKEEAKHYIIKGTEPSQFKTIYSQRNLNSLYPEVNYTSYSARIGYEMSQRLPMGIEAAINSNSVGKTIFKKTREELNEILPFKEDIIVSLLKNREVPPEILVFIPELSEKAKVKRK